MKENKIIDIIHNVNYETYLKIYRTLALTALGLGMSANTLFSNINT